MWLNIYLYASAMLWVEVPDDVRHTEYKCLLAICFQPAESWSSNTAGFREMENQMPIAVTRKGPVYIKTWIKNKPKQASKPWHGSELTYSLKARLEGEKTSMNDMIVQN